MEINHKQSMELYDLRTDLEWEHFHLNQIWEKSLAENIDAEPPIELVINEEKQLVLYKVLKILGEDHNYIPRHEAQLIYEKKKMQLLYGS